MKWSPELWDGSWLVIPDLHGHAARLSAALRVADTAYPAARLAFLGDLIDDAPRRREARRAPGSPGQPDDSREVLGRVREQVDSGRAEVLLGNHEVMAAAAVLDDHRPLMNVWWRVGGREAAASYGWNGKGDAGALAGDLRWLREHAHLWLDIGPPGRRTLLAHATRPGPERLAAGRNRAADLWPDDSHDPVVWCPLGLEGEPGARELPPLPADFAGSVHGHMETPALQEWRGAGEQPALQIDLHPGKRKLGLLLIRADGGWTPRTCAVARG